LEKRTGLLFSFSSVNSKPPRSFSQRFVTLFFYFSLCSLVTLGRKKKKKEVNGISPLKKKKKKKKKEKKRKEKGGISPLK